MNLGLLHCRQTLYSLMLKIISNTCVTKYWCPLLGTIIITKAKEMGDTVSVLKERKKIVEDVERAEENARGFCWGPGK